MENILCWDKPPRAISVEEWKSYEADGAPPGTFMPNMSEADMRKWRAKLVGHKVNQPRVEIRTAAGGALVLIVVSLTGVAYPDKYRRVGSADTNVQISMNGASEFTFNQMEEMSRAIAEAKAVLEALK